MLLGRISRWLRPEGLLFVHLFVTNALPYHFEVCTLLQVLLR